jgi:glycine cleavage system aminomethyltransferase T
MAVAGAGEDPLGELVEVDIRGRRGAATVVRPPFVDRGPR